MIDHAANVVRMESGKLFCDCDCHDEDIITIPTSQFNRLSREAAAAIEENTAFKHRCSVVLMTVNQGEAGEIDADPLVIEGMKRAAAIFMGANQ